jgi:hypothetical protein
MGLLRSKKSFSLEIVTKPLVMASEISGLEPLRGFIKQENRVVPARFALAKKRSAGGSSRTGVHGGNEIADKKAHCCVPGFAPAVPSERPRSERSVRMGRVQGH